MLRNKLFFLFAIVVLAGILLSQGCTIHFKGKDVELDAVANATYELQSVGLLDGKDR